MCSFFFIGFWIHEIKIFAIVLEYLNFVSGGLILHRFILFGKSVTLRLTIERNTRYFFIWGKWGRAWSAISLEVRTSPGHDSHWVHRARPFNLLLRLLWLDHLDLIIWGPKLGSFIRYFWNIMIRLNLRVMWDIIFRRL